MLLPVDPHRGPKQIRGHPPDHAAGHGPPRAHRHKEGQHDRDAKPHVLCRGQHWPDPLYLSILLLADETPLLDGWRWNNQGPAPAATAQHGRRLDNRALVVAVVKEEPPSVCVQQANGESKTENSFKNT